MLRQLNRHQPPHCQFAWFEMQELIRMWWYDDDDDDHDVVTRSYLWFCLLDDNPITMSSVRRFFSTTHLPILETWNPNLRSPRLLRRWQLCCGALPALRHMARDLRMRWKIGYSASPSSMKAVSMFKTFFDYWKHKIKLVFGVFTCSRKIQKRIYINHLWKNFHRTKKSAP